MQLLQGNVNPLARVQEMFWERNLPFDLCEASLNIFRDCEPLPADKVEKGLHRDVDVDGGIAGC